MNDKTLHETTIKNKQEHMDVSTIKSQCFRNWQFSREWFVYERDGSMKTILSPQVKLKGIKSPYQQV